MPNYPEIDRVVLTLIQATALLLPVVFLTFRFYEDAQTNYSESEKTAAAKKFVYMITTLTVAGFFVTIGVLDLALKPTFAFIATMSLATFFVIYGWFIYGVVS